MMDGYENFTVFVTTVLENFWPLTCDITGCTNTPDYGFMVKVYKGPPLPDPNSFLCEKHAMSNPVTGRFVCEIEEEVIKNGHA